jgi:nitrate/nitrite transporter NarK
VRRSGDEKSKIPWKSIFTSKPVWLIAIAQWGGIWGYFTIITQGPTYFRFIHGWGIEMTGILSGLPHLLRVLCAIAFGNFCDYLLSTNKMTRTNIRRLATVLSTVLNGLAVFGVAYSGCNVTMSVFFLTLSMLFHGAVSSGALASVVDISPNYASIVLGIVSTFGIATGFISPIIVGYITFENQSVTAWQHIFEICGAMLISCGLVYIFFFDASLQPWNAPKPSKELEPLTNETQKTSAKEKSLST